MTTNNQNIVNNILAADLTNLTIVNDLLQRINNELNRGYTNPGDRNNFRLLNVIYSELTEISTSLLNEQKRNKKGEKKVSESSDGTYLRDNYDPEEIGYSTGSS